MAVFVARKQGPSKSAGGRDVDLRILPGSVEEIGRSEGSLVALALQSASAEHNPVHSWIRGCSWRALSDVMAPQEGV